MRDAEGKLKNQRDAPGLMCGAHPGASGGGDPLLHANLSGMLPQMPRALNPDFAAEDHTVASAALAPESEARVEHPCQICPTCGHQREGHRCKLVCIQCGYYMSCADYY